MSGFEAINRSTAILHQKGLESEYGQCLLTFALFNSIITLINEGKTPEAIAAIDGCEHVVTILEDDLNKKDIDWYSGIIHKLRSGLPIEQVLSSYQGIYLKPECFEQRLD